MNGICERCGKKAFLMPISGVRKQMVCYPCYNKDIDDFFKKIPINKEQK
jgi:formylmethanofuran dehydrogenase subunit E